MDPEGTRINYSEGLAIIIRQFSLIITEIKSPTCNAFQYTELLNFSEDLFQPHWKGTNTHIRIQISQTSTNSPELFCAQSTKHLTGSPDWVTVFRNL